MKLAIFGGSGFLGTKLSKKLKENYELLRLDINPLSKDIHKLDSTKKEEVENFFSKYKPDIVINTIALTSSVACEKNPLLCKKLNYLTAKNILESCKKYNSKMIFISSSYVFDGKKGNYQERDRVNPQNEYAKTKVLAEKEVLKLKNSLVLRVDIMYGYNSKRSQNGIFNSILKGKKILLGNYDQIRSPLFVDELPRIIEKLIEKKQEGIFHVAGPTRIKMGEFVEGLESILRKNSKIKSLKKDKLLVKPLCNSSLNISKLNKLGIKTIPLKKGLKNLKEQLNN